MTDDVLIEKQDGLGVITLARPRAINALNHAMVLAMLAALRAWADDGEVRAVVLTGAGERGLCAGGDLVGMYADAKDRVGGPDSPSGQFWRDEYTLNALIAAYPKPYVAIMDGLVLGGGVGVSAHGSHRVVTERSSVGMPETGIGFIPDVGGTYLLSRAPGETGTHLGLTAGRMSAGDAIAAGFADHYVPSDRLPALLAALRVTEADVAIAKFAEAAPESELLGQRDWIDACYAAGSVEEIVAALRVHPAPRAGQAAADILAKSPSALKVTLRALREARGDAGLADALNREFRVSVAGLRSHDLGEGIRAQVIDKDRSPQWLPPDLADVSAELVDSYFIPLGDRELGLVDSGASAIVTNVRTRSEEQS
ncbi:enoyl-CoA hydratase/isomerase family protein [Nocardia sp. alder85J]|uniref:enoyl-CoA hydratase/isomerase family protein n=1 Tax=Nocardia sp. alder85J TaxID=2862949 RepID=UPI001CD5D2D7|nr:enoyl-CoA hydratase/isomerase family protein [Nocardia sp. alder85J]MCX4097336.1 enoyl-CoA hydratase/isomerase family protein [Nocardia sp. alder85J]